MLKKVIQNMPKIQIKHLFVLLLLLLPMILIGISNYLFATSSFHLLPDVQAAGAITRQWVGDTDGIYMTILICAVITLLWLICLCTGKLDSFITRFPQYVCGRINYVKDNPKKVLLHIALLLSIVITAALIVSFTVEGGSKLAWARMARMLYFTAAGFCVYFIVLFHKNIPKLFLLISLTIGLVFIMSHPHYFYGWDSAVHYAYSFEMSFFRYVSPTEVDVSLSTMVNGKIPYSDIPAFDGFSQYVTANELATVIQYNKNNYTMSFLGNDGYSLYTGLAYIPMGIMIFIGRSLAMAPLNILRLGLLGSHLMYTVIVYFAIKRLGSGKHIMAIIALFPTVIVTSTSYSYDYWVIAFAMLGFAYYFNEIQNPDKKIELKSIIIMIGSFVIGFGPKAIYFSMMGILYFIKRNKFKTKKGHYFYLLAVTCGILAIASVFLIPNLTGNTGEGDFRADPTVSYQGQISFILSNPLTYTRVLLENMKDYFNVFAGTNYITFFAYYGISSYFHLTWLLLLFVMFTDRNEKDLISAKAGYKVLTSIMAFGTVALFLTAMYIVISPVGSDEILGLQSRYMLPVLFPVIYILGSFKIQNNINKTAYTAGVFGIMSFVLLYGVWDKVVTKLG